MSETQEPAQYTDEDVRALIQMTKRYRFAGVFLLALYDVTRVNFNALGEFTVTSQEHKSFILDEVRKHKAAWQEDIGDNWFQWKLTPLGIAAVEQRLAEDRLFAFAGI